VPRSGSEESRQSAASLPDAEARKQTFFQFRLAAETNDSPGAHRPRPASARTANKHRMRTNNLVFAKLEVSMFARIKRRITNSGLTLPSASLLFVAVIVLSLTACSRDGTTQPTPAAARPAPQVSAAAGKTAAPSDNLTTAIERVAQETIPAVVHIEITEHQQVANPFYQYRNDPFFKYFFGLPQKMPKELQRELMGLGTGMIIDSQGHILTNYHVVGGANKIQVTLADGSQYAAEVVETDPKTDLGVIKISAPKPLPHVTFANSDDVKVGQWVVAIGHPRGLDQTVTQGIISATHRTGITDPNDYQDFLQTDAPINPGNSGGPLLNLQGQVVGVNSAILSQSGGFEGIGFAIPSNMATHVAQALITSGKVERGWIGLSVQDLNPELAKTFGLASPKGVLVADVMSGGPAAKAGIKRGDVILDYQGTEVPDAATLRNDVAEAKIGQDATLTVWRGNQKQDIRVQIGSEAEALKMLTASVENRLGVEVKDLTAEEARQYGMIRPEGVVIQSVDPKGPLGKVGFEAGDVIMAVNQEPIDDVGSFASLVTSLPHHKKVVLMALNHRNGQTAYVSVDVP
jgi:Do/DeqQ family serine protease